MNCKIKMNNNNSGLSILEALVSTAIVGIGFIAILQMTNFSVQSIDNSGERTKANFISTMLVEDVIGNKNTFYGASADKATDANERFSEYLANRTDPTSGQKGWHASTDCAGNTGLATNTSSGTDVNKGVYSGAQYNDAPQNKMTKWEGVFTKGKFLKCKSNQEKKKLQVFKMCRWSGCPIINSNIYDDPMYIGRLEVRINSGDVMLDSSGQIIRDAQGEPKRKFKKKFVYFQTDYKIKE